MKTMFVRFIGDKVCWTVGDGRFYIGDRDEANATELAACEAGGADLPLSAGIDAAAK